MNEKPPIGDMRMKVKEMRLTPDSIKEFADLIPKPENHFHYRITGEWQPNREVYRVSEGDHVYSDYSFPVNSDMNKVQYAARKTYAKEANLFGKLTDYPVSFDRKSGQWKKLNIIQRVRAVFTKESNIPASVVTERVNGKDVSVLHTLEQKRPVGQAVQEAKLTTIQDVRVDLGVKYKHIEHSLTVLKDANKVLKGEATASAAAIVALRRQVVQANGRIAELSTQLRMQQEQAKQRANEANPHYSGPIYTKPNPADVVEGEVVE